MKKSYSVQRIFERLNHNNKNALTYAICTINLGHVITRFKKEIGLLKFRPNIMTSTYRLLNDSWPIQYF